MAITIYSLCALTSLACAWLLFASYRRTGHKLLFWSGACFAVMTVSNVLLIVDKLMLPTVDLLLARLVTALLALLLLVYGLIYAKE